MKIQAMFFRCRACNNEWVGEVISDAPAPVVVASMRAITCPDCRATSKHIVLQTQSTK